MTIQAILERCKCGVFLSVNQHRDYYKTAEEYILEEGSHGGPVDLAEDVRTEMIKTDTVICLQFYPDTPVGFYQIWHHDFDEIIRLGLECLKEEE